MEEYKHEEEKKEEKTLTRRDALKRMAKIGAGVAGVVGLASCDWLYYYNYYSDYYYYSNYYSDYYYNYYSDYYNYYSNYGW